MIEFLLIVLFALLILLFFMIDFIKSIQELNCDAIKHLAKGYDELVKHYFELRKIVERRSRL